MNAYGRDRLSINLWWDQRFQPAGDVAAMVRQWLASVATLSEFAGLSFRALPGKGTSATKPGRLMSVQEIIPFLGHLGAARSATRPAESCQERSVAGFKASLFDPTIRHGERFRVVFICGGWAVQGNGGSINFPALVAAGVTPAWREQVMETLITAFDPDEVWLRAWNLTRAGDDIAVSNVRYWLRWDRGRVPLTHALDKPAPPPLSRPWLCGTLHEWPEHAALFGATPD